ncbi:MAG: hypothetical protein ACK51L_04105, partial [bacterium]
MDSHGGSQMWRAALCIPLSVYLTQTHQRPPDESRASYDQGDGNQDRAIDLALEVRVYGCFIC